MASSGEPRALPLDAPSVLDPDTRRSRRYLDRILAGSSAPADVGGDQGAIDGVESPITHLELIPATAGRPAPWPEWAPQALVSRLTARGIHAPWAHQAHAAQLAHSGAHTVISTGTASGKSLAYQLPGLAAVLADDRARVLYLSPTKALAADQWSALHGLALPSLRAATLDGDTALGERDWVRAHANWVLTNPDMLHRAVLPAHARWASFLRRLRYVVIDECHAYRGMFGSHVALVLRRLRRICASYGSAPTFILASATVANPEASAAKLIGAPVSAVAEDAAPHAARLFALWEPPLSSVGGENGAPVRRPAGTEAGRILADLVVEGARTLAFVRSRRGAELTAAAAKRRLIEAEAQDLAQQVAAYRAGYLPAERRALEADLESGRLLGMAATNALELGIDIAGLDAVVVAGFPGRMSSLWQQAGRAGRGEESALVVFVARDDPLDTYLAHHPEAVFGRPIEATVLDPGNPYALAPQLCCAAAELPIREEDLELLGGAPARTVLDELTAQGALRRRPAGWYWTSRRRPDADIRGAGGPPVQIVEAGSGQLLGTVDAPSAPRMVHDGALYLHQGSAYVVRSLDLDDAVALVDERDPPWTTTAREITDIAVIETLRTKGAPDGVARAGDYGVSAHFGAVEVTNQVVGYQRRQLRTGEVLDDVPLDMPPQQLRTASVWYTITPDALVEFGLDIDDVPGAAHAAEHAAIGLLPLFATCDRWDIGGVSTALHPDTELATVFVYDGHPGGAGFSARGYDVIDSWLSATRAAIAACECARGCPSCVQSPKCGNGNEPLDKAGAIRLLDAVLRALQ